MSLSDTSEKVLLDIRHTKTDENVGCMSQVCESRWAQFVMESSFNPLTGKHGKCRTYLCHKCTMKLLQFADALGVG